MNSDDFRSSSERVARLRELLQDPILAAAIVCLQDEKPKGDVHAKADAIESVRILSRQSGWEGAISMLIELSTPLPKYESEEQPTWGTLPTVHSTTA